jgi:Insertion element 4 transposase N-terminal
LRVQSAIRTAVVAITWTVTVAAGAFVPGHLGELTRIVPFELVDEVLEETGGRERRLRRRLLDQTMLVLADRGFGAAGFLAEVAAARSPTSRCATPC